MHYARRSGRDGGGARTRVSVSRAGRVGCGWAGAAHFLFADGAGALRALEGAGIRVLIERDVLAQRLRAERAGTAR
jgi:hypothetical protein